MLDSRLMDGGDDTQVRLLQGRFEAADMESKELQDKLKIAHATNARLAAELEEASSLLLKYSEKKDTGREVEDMYRRRLSAAEQELHKAEYTFQVNSLAVQGCLSHTGEFEQVPHKIVIALFCAGKK